ncbi:MAG: menaquinone biosynthesis protein [Acidobacteriota bacterium]|nr:menaquinone biosynthesis protein [Acidobacteriota bacterium]
MPPSRKLRAGIVDYLNAWPLAWGFLAGALQETYDPVYLPPAGVARELSAGRLDVGLVPSIEVQRQPDLLVIPGLCVAATHEVRSVILVSRRPIESIRRVALDHNSRTSAVLVQILLGALHGIAVEVEEASPDVEEMLARADAALLIGDPALRVDRRGLEIWDLAGLWRELTGLPFVFAVWALHPRAGTDAPRIVGDLHRSLELGLAELDRLVARATEELGLQAEEVRTYLTRNLSYRLDSEALAGLHAFHQRAEELGFIAESRAIAFTGPAIDPPSVAAEGGSTVSR